MKCFCILVISVLCHKCRKPELLKDQLVACVPGNAFGQAGEGYIRVSYAYSIEQIKEATSRIKKFLDKLNSK